MRVHLQGWEIGLYACACLVSVTAIVRLMQARQNQLTTQLLRQAEAEHREKAKADRATKSKKR